VAVLVDIKPGLYIDIAAHNLSPHEVNIMVIQSSTLLTAMGLACLIVLDLGPLQAQDTPSGVRVSVVADAKPGLASQHGLKQVKEALQSKKVFVEEVTSVEAAGGNVVVVAGLGTGPGAAANLLKALEIAPPDGAESILIQNIRQKDKKLLLVCGGDDRGLMYALLEVADRIGWADLSSPFAEVHDVREKPAVAERGMSTYAMQQAYFESRLFNEDYWNRYFDLLARNRFNSYILIFGYENAGYLAPPYPYFCDVEGFADVRVAGLSKEQQARNLAALQRLIRQAHARGIRFSVGIWDHIYRGGVQTGGAKEAKPGRPGTVTGVTEKNLLAYTRAAFASFMRSLPELDGVQFRMHDESGLKAGAEMREFWTGMFDYLNRSDRKLRFELRAKAMPDDIIDLAVASGIDFRLSTRYWAEQMGLPYHPTHINRQNQFDRRHSYADLLRYPRRYPMLWQLWTGGTTRLLLWGDPEYARRFTQTTHLYDGEGFTVYEPLTTKMASHPHDQKPVEILTAPYRYYDYEFERYWHFFQSFGRIGYNPQTPPEVWQKEFERRFGKEAGPLLEAALHRASQILPRINATIFPYNHFPTTMGWAEKQRKGDLAVYAKAETSDTQQFLSMDQAAQLLLDGGESAKIAPQRTSDWFARTAVDVLEKVAQAEARIGKHKSKEFVSTITDLRILAHLAQYHSRRMHAGIHYSLFKRSKDLHALDDAINFEQQAIEAWAKLVEAAGDVYAEDLMMGRPEQGLSGHWKDELAALRTGLSALQKERQDFQPTPAITHIPIRTAVPGADLVIRATIGGAGTKTEVRVAHRTGEGEWKFVKMDSAKSSRYRAVLPAAAVVGGLQYYLDVTDSGQSATFPREGVTKPLIVTVTSDTTPPEVVHTPITVAQAGKPLSIKAQVKDASGVKWARVLYRDVNQKQDYTALPMTPAGGKDQFEATIPASAITTQWDFMYLIEVMDNNGNGRIYPDLEKETPYVFVRVQRL
jgi:hypothetical protein